MENTDNRFEGKESKEKNNKRYIHTFTASFEVDFKFWSTGAVNLNIHAKELEIEFLCFGIYFGKL